MSSDLNITIRLNPLDGTRDDYPVQLWYEGKPLADGRARIDRQVLLAKEHAFSAPEYGMELYDALFTGKLGREYQRLVGQAGAETTVHIHLVLPPELQALPWERLFHVLGDREAPLAASAQTPFARFLISGLGDQAAVSSRPLRLLVAIANPANLPADLVPLQVASEIVALADLLARLRGRVVGSVLPGCSGLPKALLSRLEQEGWTVHDGVTSWQNIQRHLAGQHVLHLLAHGQFRQSEATAYLLLEHEGSDKVLPGTLERVADQVIVDGLAGVHPLPQLVFLAACDSAKRPEAHVNPFVGLAPRLVEAGVPAVVAMQGPVPIDLAHTLTTDFYSRLFAHGQVDRALNEARALLFERDQFEWAIPVLFLRLTDGRLFQQTSTFALRRIFDGLIEQYTEIFAGRDAEINALHAFVRELAGGYLLVTAGAGLGKTALMANVVASHPGELAYHFFAPHESESLKEEIFLRNLLEQMGPWYGVSDPPTGQLADLRKRYDTFLGQSPDGLCTVLLDGLDEVAGWDLSRYLSRRLPPGLHFILTVRDVGRVPVADYDLPAEQVRPIVSLSGLTREGVRAVLRAAGGSAVHFADDEAHLDDVMRVTIYDQAQPELGADPLFVRFLAEDAAVGTLRLEEVATLPPTMEDYLKRWWLTIRAEFGERGRQATLDQVMVDLFGTLTAALGPITRVDLQAINFSLVHPVIRNFFDEVLERVRRIVVHDTRGGYTLLHPRLRAYLQQMIETRPYTEKLLLYCEQWRVHQSRYALTYYASHLAEAAVGAAPLDQHALTERLVRLVTDAHFQDVYLAEVKDLRALQADLERTLQTAVADDIPAALPLVVESALALVHFRRERLRPEPLFEFARRGEVKAARQMIELFEMDRKWRQTALLVIAWLAGHTNSQEARTLYMEVASEIAGFPMDDQRQLLLQRIKAELEGGPLPSLQLPPVPSEAELRAALDRAGGISPEADLNPELLARGLPVNENLLARGLDLPSDTEQISDEIFLSFYFGPPMVALAVGDPHVGEHYLQEYLRLQSAYNYPTYRFGSLWALLRAVLQHPEQAWVKEKVRELAIAALGGASVEFQEGLPLTVLALRARAGEAGTVGHLQDLARQIWQEAEKYEPGQGQGDTWGRYKRLLATLAQVQAALSVDVGYTPAALLQRAQWIRYGFAGYHAPACLALAEAIRICQPKEEQTWPEGMLESAQQAAHNIQEGTFCARITGRVNAMRAFWWPPTGLDVAQKSAALHTSPRSQEFASLHYVGHQYQGRGQRPQSWPLPHRVQEANTLVMLADAYQRALSEFLRLNRDWEPDQVIPSGERIYVPDPGLAPLLAARLAAEALVASRMSDSVRAALIQSLVPVAAANPTTLDTVLARLLLAAQPSDPLVLERLAALVPFPRPPSAPDGEPGTVRT
jgi:hypothetical protein